MDEDQVEFAELTLDQAKIYLVNLGVELYCDLQFFKLRVPQSVVDNLEIGGFKKKARPLFQVKRSLSNPLDGLPSHQRASFQPKVIDRERQFQSNRTMMLFTSEPGGYEEEEYKTEESKDISFRDVDSDLLPDSDFQIEEDGRLELD